MAFNDYPKSATANAKRAIALNKENGNRCATAVGRETGRILANRESISKARTVRMFSYLSRARTYYKPDDTSACGTISFLMWGGLPALRWSKRKVEQMENEERNALMHEITLREKYGDDVETRVAKITAVERSENNEMVVEGMAAVFDTITDIGPFQERIDPAAFDGRLNDDVRFLVNHDGLPLARTSNGTLTLEKRDGGLFMRAQLADTERGREIYKLIKRGDIDEMSFAAKITRDGWQPDDDGVRVISRVESLVDVSAVTYGAYSTTSIHARSWAEAQNEIEAETQPETETIETPEIEVESRAIQKEQPKLHTKPVEDMNLNELKAIREKYFAEHAELIRKADTEPLSESDEQRADFLVLEVERLDNKIRHRANAEKMKSAVHVGTTMNASERKEIERMNQTWSLSRAIKQITTNGRLDGVEAEWTAEARKDNEKRGLEMDGNVGIPAFAIYRAGETDQMAATTASGDAGGAGFVPENVPGSIEALRAPSVIEQTGVTVINGATGNLKFPRISTKATLAEATEIASTTAAGIQMDEVTLTPERVTAYTTYSKQLALQGGNDVDRLILNDLVGAMNARIDTSAFADIIATTDGSTINIAGTDGTNDALNAALVYQMESQVLADGANLGGCVWVMSPKAFQHSRSEAAVASVSALWDQQTFAGYRALATPYLLDDVLDDTSSVGGQMLFGNFQQGGVLARFGSPDILVDPFTAASTGQIKIHINAFWDFALRQPAALSFADQLT